MMTISGKVEGGVKRISFTPTRKRFALVDGSEIIVSAPVFADLVLEPEGVSMSVALHDQDEWNTRIFPAEGDNPADPREAYQLWRWICTEQHDSGEVFSFAIGAYPGDYRYVDIRPLEGL